MVVNALPKSRVAKVELCSLDSLLKVVRQGSPAWFAVVR